MSAHYFALVEIGLTFFGVLAFAWWQLHTLKRDRAITDARLRAERDAEASAAPGHPER